MTTAKELLRPCPSVRETVTVGELLQRMHQDDYFAVVDEQDRMLGILTQYDLVKLIYESGEIESDAVIGSRPAYLGYSREQLRALTAADVMTNDPETVGPNAELDDLITIVFRNRRKVVPVVERGKVLGVVWRRDLLSKVLG